MSSSRKIKLSLFGTPTTMCVFEAWGELRGPGINIEQEGVNGLYLIDFTIEEAKEVACALLASVDAHEEMEKKAAAYFCGQDELE